MVFVVVMVVKSRASARSAPRRQPDWESRSGAGSSRKSSRRERAGKRVQLGRRPFVVGIEVGDVDDEIAVVERA